MSRVTNPDTEGSVSCGFFNSVSHDRKYDALQMSRIFDGVIRDGVFASIGTCFVVTEGSGFTVNVGVGKAWFDHSWIENNAVLPVTLSEPELLLDRIDAIVIEVNHTALVRDCIIKVITGTPGAEPERPTLINNEDIHQHALCYIMRNAESTSIGNADITNVVGTDETPFVTGILQVVSLDVLLGQWRAQLNQFVADEESDFATWSAGQRQAFDDWFAEIQGLISGDLGVRLTQDVMDLEANKANKSAKVETTLLSANWSEDEAPYTYTLSVAGATANNNIELVAPSNLTATQVAAYVDAQILNGTQTTGSITLNAWGDKPEVDLPITIILRGD